MPEVFYYQVNGFEKGPAPLSEIRRLIHKGRIAPDTWVRQHGGEWARAEQVAAEETVPVAIPDPETAVHEPWHFTVLERFAPVGIPLGLILLPWGRVAASVGLLLLSPFAVALIRLFGDIGRELKAIAEE